MIMDILALCGGLLLGAWVLDHMVMPMFRRDPAYRWFPTKGRGRR